MNTVNNVCFDFTAGHPQPCDCARCVEIRKQQAKERYDQKLREAGVRVYVWQQGGEK